ncbi:MAG: hydantoinase B/oxoprolinase family protein [Armatimonadota bacterium]
MPSIDAIALQVQWSRLITIMDEVDAALVRTSFSTIVGETRDFAVILLDGHARSVAQSQLSSPGFTCSLPFATRHMLRQFPPHTGDRVPGFGRPSGPSIRPAGQDALPCARHRRRMVRRARRVAARWAAHRARAP